MAQLTSEAEFERLYQEFVRRNGGIPTLVADQYNTPASYYQATKEVTLSPSELAQLQARQAQYNRQAALNTISNEIGSNNFTNPYNARSQASIANLNSISAQPININDYVLGTPINTTSYAQLGNIRNAFSFLTDPARGGSVALAAVVYAGISEATGIDIEKLILGAGLITAGVAMFTDLQGHTDGQVSDLPAKMNEIDQLTGMQQSFGEMSGDSCSLFNQLMGILSGAFDGVLDFIDSGVEKFKDFLAQTQIGQLFNQIAGAIGQAVAGITGAIAGVVSTVISAVSDALAPIIAPFKDILNSIGDIASSVLGAIGDMASQIANEIQGLLDMAADIANKAAALAMAAAMLDPCKLAVLLNTGSPALAGAAQQITAPIESAVPGLNIPTQIDPRADSAEVLNTVQQAQRMAQTQPGVPQSPINALAQLYQPFDAYLNGLFSSLDGIFGGAFETVKTLSGGSLVNNIGDTMPSNPAMASLNNITGSLQGTIGDISNNIAPLASGTSLSPVGSSNITGSNTDNDDFSTGGAINTEAQDVETTPTLSSRLDGKDGTIARSVNRTSSETPTHAKLVTEQTAEGTVTRLEGPSQQIAKVRATWNKEYKSEFGRIIRDIGRGTGLEIKKYLNSATFKNSEQKREAELLYEDCLRLKNDVTTYMKSQAKKFDYHSNTQDRDNLQEKRIAEEYTNIIAPQNKIQLDRYKQEVYEIQSTWGSIKRQAIL